MKADPCKWEFEVEPRLTASGVMATITGKKWLGPRSKKLSGTAKRLARLNWDRKRLQ